MDWQKPVRIVIDRHLQLSDSLKLLDQSQQTIVFNSRKTELIGNTKFLELEDFDNLLPQLICYQLYLMDIQSMIIEGGAQTLKLFIDAGLWDEARVFISTGTWETGLQAPIFTGQYNSESVADDTLQIWLKH